MSAVAIAMGAGKYNGPPLLFLICGFERHVVRLIQLNLERQGHTVVCANDAQHAVDQMQLRIENRSKMFDRVLLDGMLPKKGGSEVLKWIRTHPETEGIWVAMKAGNYQEQEGLDGYEYQPDELLQWPGDPNDLLK